MKNTPSNVYATGHNPDNMYTVLHVYGTGSGSFVGINLIDIVYDVEQT